LRAAARAGRAAGGGGPAAAAVPGGRHHRSQRGLGDDVAAGPDDAGRLRPVAAQADVPRGRLPRHHRHGAGSNTTCGLLGRRTAQPRRRTRSDGGGSDLGAGGQAQGPRRRGRGAGELGRPAMTVVLVDPRRPSLVPVEALALLSGEVAYTEELPVAVPWALPSAQSVLSGGNAPTLLSSDRDHPAV